MMFGMKHQACLFLGIANEDTSSAGLFVVSVQVTLSSVVIYSEVAELHD